MNRRCSTTSGSHIAQHSVPMPLGMYGSGLEQFRTLVLLWMVPHGPFGPIEVCSWTTFFSFVSMTHHLNRRCSTTSGSHIAHRSVPMSLGMYGSGLEQLRTLVLLWMAPHGPFGRLEVCSWTTSFSFFGMTHDVNRCSSMRSGTPIAQRSVPMSLGGVWE